MEAAMEAVSITFGVEVEFMVPFIFDDEEDPEEHDWRQLNIINSGHGIDPSLQIHTELRLTLAINGLPAIRMGREILPTQWAVVHDASVVASNSMEELYGDRWSDVEVVSPALPVDAFSFNDVQVAINSIFSQYRMYTPPSCGTHVHVGNGTNGFTLDALKNIAGFLYIFERQLSALHPLHRQDNDMCFSMRQWSTISGCFHDLLKGLQSIYRRTTIESLVTLVHDYDEGYPPDHPNHLIRGMQYNFKNLLRDDGRKTIEFRQFEATSDGLEVRRWAETCTAIVHACAMADINQWVTFLHSNAEIEMNRPQDMLTISDLLLQFGYPTQAAWAEERNMRFYPSTRFPSPEHLSDEEQQQEQQYYDDDDVE
jgi:hypothetical protein